MLLDLVHSPEDTLLWGAIFDAGHAPLFGVIALMTLELSRRVLLPRRPARTLYLAAFAVTALLGAGSEALQFFLPRDSDPVDLLRNLAGAAAFLALYAALDRRHAAIRGRGRRLASGLFGALLLVIVLVPVAGAARSYLERDEAFPILYDFEHGWCSDFLKYGLSTIRLTAAPPGWPAPAPRRVARVLFSASRLPHVVLEEPRPDWSGYATLAFEVFLSEQRPVIVRVAVDDRLDRLERAARFDRPYVLRPGLNRFRIPLDEIRRGPLMRALDTDHVRVIMLYVTMLDRPVELYLGPIRLER